ncbi:SH3 domain-containing protein C23A1.17 isoform X2 [Ooceraea biroi]|uniref:SH3 domain-containing protein C23A1.17 isoform X2 n=1 Tax=Ooceraea biroi TaxID=2015173 RepID=UPI0005B89181|nr:SH3 domain-containing protein C23A1.17 isoform X2 [Ooceraea biroi]
MVADSLKKPVQLVLLHQFDFDCDFDLNTKMHLKNYSALLLLAFVACQAAPSPKIIDKKSISGAETELTKDSLTLEDAGADKDRSKKSATTFCVEDPKFSILPLPAPAPTSLTIVQPAPVPAPTSMAIVQPAPAPAPAPAPVTIVQPAPAPCAPEPFSVNVIQPAPAQTETIFVQPTQPAPQPQVANIVLPPQPAPQLAPQIVVPAPAPAPTQYLNIQPAAPCAPQQTSYFLQTPTVSQPVQYHYLQPQAPQIVPQPTVTVIQPEPIKLEQEKFIKPQVKPMSLVQVLPEQSSHDVFQCNCRPESHLKSRHSNIQQRLPIPASLGPAPAKMMMATQSNPNLSTGVPVLTTQTREAEPRHHKHRIYLTPMDPYSTMYAKPAIAPSYYEYNSYLNSYPAVSYNPNPVYSYPYGNVPSQVTVNAGGPFLGQTLSRDAQAHSEPHQPHLIASEVGDFSSNQKRAADPTQLKNIEQNEIMQEGKTITIKEASADTIKLGNTK